MSDLETTQAKLRSTPTAGVSGEHSPYFRKLASAGYKGYVQGMIAGGSLYGTMGLVVGAVVALPAAALLASTLPLLAIPAVAGIGALHGAHSFADISKTAAMLAESAETNEKRRYLLDRYYETPNDAEAAEIRNILEQQMKPQMPEQMFHWRTVVVGALIGLAVTGGLLLLASNPAAATFLGIGHGLEGLAGMVGLHYGAGIAANAGIVAFGTALGTAAGGLIGLDREYVRRWLDKAEFAVHDTSRTDRELAAHEREVSRLGAVAKEQPVFKNAEFEKLVYHTEPAANVNYRPAAPLTEELSTATPAVTTTPHPTTQIRDAKLQERVTQLQQALAPSA